MTSAGCSNLSRLGVQPSAATKKVLRALASGAREMRRMVGSGSAYHDYRQFALQDGAIPRSDCRHVSNILLSDTLRRLRSHLRLYRLYHPRLTCSTESSRVSPGRRLARFLDSDPGSF